MKPKWQKLASLAQEIYAHCSFSSLMQSLLPKDTLLRTYLKSRCLALQLSPANSMTEIMNHILLHLNYVFLYLTLGPQKKKNTQKNHPHPGPQIRVHNGKLFFLFLNQNICCVYSKEPSHREGSSEHPKHMFKLMDKKIIAILR